jgi:hypothetical protein
MKKLIIAFLLFLNTNLIFAQKEFPKFGSIDKADLTMTECEYDKDAVAFKLIDYGEVQYIGNGENGFKIQSDIRKRIKILKDKGLEYANIKIRFYTRLNYEVINNISAVTYNLDNTGNIVTTKVEKASIYSKKIDRLFSEISFTMPDVKPGSVIEYKYTRTKQSFSTIPNWDFQDDIPVRISMYDITIPSFFKFVTQTLAYQKVEEKDDETRGTVSIGSRLLSFTSLEKKYILRQIPALRDEPYMGAAKDYLQRVVFQLSAIEFGDGTVINVRSTWTKLTEDLLDDEDFGLQLKKNIPHTKSLDDSIKNVKSDYEKMLVIHDYVRRNMNWNGGESIYTEEGIKSAWDKKTGTNGEINLILINLLRDAGLTAFPLLISSKDNGTVNTLYPFLDQFNNTMACAVIDNKRFILNAADKYNPAYLIPYDVLNNEGFIVDKDNGGWISLEDDKDMFKSVVSIFSEVEPDGIMKGDATIFSFGYCKNPRVKKWKEDKTAFEELFSKSFTGMKINDMQVENENIDTMPLQQKVNFSMPLSSSGDYEYFSINLFQGLEKNPFIADERFSDIDFGYRQSYTLVGKIYIPDGFEFDELPKNIKMIMPDTSIVMQRMMQADSNSIDLKLTIDFKSPFYAASSYPEFHEFYKKLFATLNEQVVIKKKKV